VGTILPMFCPTDPAENRKVGGSIPSLPTTSALVRKGMSQLPEWLALVAKR
jgi:hypothetical protein